MHVAMNKFHRRRIKTCALMAFLILIFLIYLVLASDKYTTNTPSNLFINTNTSTYNELTNAQYGEMGLPVHEISREKYPSEVNSAYRTYGFNQFLSDKISLKRSLPDVRDSACLKKQYSQTKLKVSVIIVFYDEGMSTLYRTVYSVLDRSPPNLLHEVILVDDYSTLNHLKTPLEEWVKSFSGRVKLVRMSIHEGLIVARNTGAAAASGDVLLFLDSHCEATTGWLLPLLEPIYEDYRKVTAPIIDVIKHDTFEYSPIHNRVRGTFSWLFYYKERNEKIPIFQRIHDLSENIKSPVMAGGLFAISKKWWDELGQYDPELFLWGGEQYEISFKIWMCGGELLNVPCSHVGHIYRGPGMVRDNQNIHSRHPNSVMVNYKRVAEVWMDDFKHFLYMNHQGIANADIGQNIEQRKQLRKSLNCKNFDWYLRNVIKDTLDTRYEPNLGFGPISAVYEKSGQKMCVCNRGMNNPVDFTECRSCSSSWRYTWIGEFKEDEHCFDYDPSSNQIYNRFCHENRGNQHFYYDKESKLIKMDSNSHECIMADQVKNKLIRQPCDSKNLDYIKVWNIDLIDNSNPPEWSKVALHPSRKH